MVQAAARTGGQRAPGHSAAMPGTTRDVQRAHDNRKGNPLETAILQLEGKLKEGQGRFTVTEASAMTGIFVDHAKDALDELIQKYVCRLQVTENGDLIYDFGVAPRRRGRVSLREILSAAGEVVWNVFMFVFKIWIAFTLVFYFFVSFFIIVALLVFILGSKLGDSDRSGGSGGNSSGGMVSGLFSAFFRAVAELAVQVFGSLGRIFFSLFRWKTNTGDILEQKDRLGYAYKKFKPKSGIINPKKKNFVASVYDFVFGPKRVEIDPLNNEKEVAAYLQQQKGILVISELIGLAGWTLSQAREFFTDCLIRFKGEVHVSENGAMFGEFHEIVRGTGAAETGEIIWYWDEYEPEYEVTGNTFWRNGLIFFLNFTTWIVSFEVFRFFGFLRDILGTHGDGVVYRILFFFPVTVPAEFVAEFEAEGALFFYTYFGFIPLLFSTLFFLVPLMRHIKYRKANRSRIQRNLQKKVFKAIYEAKGAPQTLAQYLERINRHAEEAPVEKAQLESLLNEIVLDLGGDTDVAESGELVYRFQGIALELDEAKSLRSGRAGDADLGAVVFDTGRPAEA